MMDYPPVPGTFTNSTKIIVTISNPTAVKFLTTLLLHEPFTPFSQEEEHVGRQAITRMHRTSPPYTTYVVPPNNPTTISMYRYDNGHYVHVDAHLSRNDAAQLASPVQVTMVRRSDNQAKCLALFYYTMRALDSNVTIPRLLRNFDRNWKYDYNASENKTINYEEVRRQELSVQRLFTEGNQMDDFMIATLFHSSGATILQLFKKYPKTFARFEHNTQTELKRLCTDPKTNPFQWETLMTYALLLHRMFQADPTSFVRPICKTVWDTMAKFPVERQDPYIYPHKLPFVCVQSFGWF